MKNKIMLSNFNSCQILINIIFLLGGFYYLEGVSLYSMIFVSSIGLIFNAYVLWWSYKNKIYDADLLFRFSPAQSVIGVIGIVLFSSIRPFFNYCVVASVVAVFIYLNSMTTTDYEQHPWVYGIIWVISVFAAISSLFGGCLYIVSILSTTENMFPAEKAGFIEQFKLNINNTIFFSSGSEITGFLTSGLLYVKDHGLIYDNTTYKPDDVISYLKAANIKFSELDREHIKVMTMHCYA